MKPDPVKETHIYTGRTRRTSRSQVPACSCRSLKILFIFYLNKLGLYKSRYTFIHPICKPEVTLVKKKKKTTLEKSQENPDSKRLIFFKITQDTGITTFRFRKITTTSPNYAKSMFYTSILGGKAIVF